MDSRLSLEDFGNRKPFCYRRESQVRVRNSCLDSSQVLLHLTDRSPSDSRFVLEYHVYVCQRPAKLDGDVASEEFPGREASCRSTVTANTTLTVVRKPWFVYEVSIVTCYGSSGHSSDENLSLPLFREKPRPVTELWWDQEAGYLRWKCEPQNLSGFHISLCPNGSEGLKDCSGFQTGPLDRLFNVGDLVDELLSMHQ